MLAISIPEKIKRAVDRHPDWTDNRIQKSAGGSQAMVRAVRAGEPLPPTVADARPALPAYKPTGGNGGGLISLARIVEKFDIRAAILREIAALPEGELIPEKELCLRTAGKDQNRFRRCVENFGDEFKPLRVKARLDDASEGKWLWGRAKDIEVARVIIEG